MTTFDEREGAFERKFVLDEDQKFRATARRNRMLGNWAAEQLGKSGDEATAYAKEVVASDIIEAGEHDVFRKVRADFDAADVSVSDEEIRTAMRDFLDKAAAEIKAGR
jgi:hypothetical protein